MPKKQKNKRIPEHQQQEHAKRVRTDTFWGHESVAGYFDAIYDGTHEMYELDFEADVNLDYKGRRRCCWMVRNRVTKKQVAQLLATPPYRLSLEWSVAPATNFWGEKMKRKVKTALPSIQTKYASVSRHRCPNPWCCRPDHIQIGARAQNERDKAFHYFLKSKQTSKRFMETFRAECAMQRLWGVSPPPD